jgi:hypothetical protein
MRMQDLIKALTCVAGLAGFGFAVTPAAAAAVDVDLELVLAVDVSGSMNVDEQRLQRQGYASAISSPEVIHAITGGTFGRIALTYVEWAGPGQQHVMVPWTVIAGFSEALGFAERVSAAPLMQQGGTSISNALLFAREHFEASGVHSLRRVVDLSGDGPNNVGPPVDQARDRLVSEGITINGLPITLEDQESFYSYPLGAPNILATYFEDCVIGGPGAFLVMVDDVSGFEIAIRRKLVIEISGLPARVLAAREVARSPRVDCLLGENKLHSIQPGHRGMHR